VAARSLPCLAVAEMIFVIEERRKEIASTEPPEFTHPHTDYETVAGVSLKCFRVNLDHSCCLLTVEQRLENLGEVGHGSYTPRTHNESNRRMCLPMDCACLSSVMVTMMVMAVVVVLVSREHRTGKRHQ